MTLRKMRNRAGKMPVTTVSSKRSSLRWDVKSKSNLLQQILSASPCGTIMLTLKLTRADFKKSDWHWSDYVGKHDLFNCDSNIEIDANLGCVSFRALKTKGQITALAGTGIQVIEGIETGGGIKSDWGIHAKADIQAAKGIEAGADIKTAGRIIAGWSILAGESIEADGDIKAGTAIKAGAAIRAGGSIEFWGRHQGRLVYLRWKGHQRR